MALVDRLSGLGGGGEGLENFHRSQPAKPRITRAIVKAKMGANFSGAMRDLGVSSQAGVSGRGDWGGGANRGLAVTGSGRVRIAVG